MVRVRGRSGACNSKAAEMKRPHSAQGVFGQCRHKVNTSEKNELCNNQHIYICICISSCIDAEMNKKFDALNGMPPPNVCRVAATNTPLQICMYICICNHLCTPCRHLEDRLVIQVCAHIVNILVAKLTSFEYCCASQPTIGTIAHIYTHVLVCVCGCCAFICSYLFMQQCTVVC